MPITLRCAVAQGEEDEYALAARETFKPGRVVWAKVEGHDWWPAKVVRRRAGEAAVGAGRGFMRPGAASVKGRAVSTGRRELLRARRKGCQVAVGRRKLPLLLHSLAWPQPLPPPAPLALALQCLARWGRPPAAPRWCATRSRWCSSRPRASPGSWRCPAARGRPSSCQVGGGRASRAGGVGTAAAGDLLAGPSCQPELSAHQLPCTECLAAPASAPHPAGEATAEDEEAEYAWLSADALKVYNVGDGSAAGDGQTVPDANLAACIAAAERAVVGEQRAIEAAGDGAWGWLAGRLGCCSV